MIPSDKNSGKNSRAHRQEPTGPAPSGLSQSSLSQAEPLVPCAFAEAVRILEAHWYSDAELAEWLNAPQQLFGNLSPSQMLAVGKKAQVLACIQQLDDGGYL